MCIDALAAERSRQHTKYVQAATGQKIYATKPKQVKELKNIQTLCQQFGQKTALNYLEDFALRMELPNPEEEYMNPEPSTATPDISTTALFAPEPSTATPNISTTALFAPATATATSSTSVLTDDADDADDLYN